jgi:DNA-binding protein WhiA
MSSFSNTTKRELLEIGKLKKCCAFSFLYGCFYLFDGESEANLSKKTNAENAKYIDDMLASVLKNKEVKYDAKKREMRVDKGVVRYFTIAEYKDNVFKCASCEGCFLRAIFLMCGSVNDPEKSYRLELVFDKKSKGDEITELLCELGFIPKTSIRNGKYIIYFRDSEQIENFLTLIGAVNATFAVMNSKIYKEFVNNANRAANCDTANINKSLKANEKYISAIQWLIDTGSFDALSEQLKETANKRLEFKELNFEQLGKRFEPPISKSGMYHRLEKILEIYNEIRKS